MEKTLYIPIYYEKHYDSRMRNAYTKEGSCNQTFAADVQQIVVNRLDGDLRKPHGINEFAISDFFGGYCNKEAYISCKYDDRCFKDDAETKEVIANFIKEHSQDFYIYHEFCEVWFKLGLNYWEITDEPDTDSHPHKFD